MAADRPLDRKPPAEGTVPLTPPGQGRARGAPDRLLGHLIDSRFRLRAVLGEGGMGRVYLAEDEKLNRRRVALKIMGTALTMEPEFRARFHREAVLQANLPHPQIIQVLDIGECPEGAYIVMEYSDGQSLSILLKELGPRPLDRALEATEQILEVLDFAHRQGVVHRDLKPSNILVEERAGREFVRILDFGIAKLMTKDGPGEYAVTLTKAGHAYGTLGYMAPEQAKGEAEKLDHRADIYSVGIILHEMLTGEVPAPPEARTHPVRYAMWVASNPVKPLRESHPELDVAEEVDSIIRSALRRDPEKRFASALAFLNAVRQFRRSSEASTVRRQPVRHAAAGRSGDETGGRSARRSPVALLGWVLAVLLLAGAGLAWFQYLDANDQCRAFEKDVALVQQALGDAGIRTSSVSEGVAELARRAQAGGGAEAAERIKELERKTGQLETDLTAAQGRADSLKQQVDQSGSALVAAREAAEKAANERSKALEDLARANGELEQARKKVEELKTRVSPSDPGPERARLEQELKSARDALAAADRMIDDLKKSAQGSVPDVEAARLAGELDKAKADLVEARRDVEAVKKERDEITEEATKLRRELESKAGTGNPAQLQALEQSLAQVKLRADGLDRELLQKEGQLREARSREESAQAEKVRVQQELDSARGRVSELERQLQTRGSGGQGDPSLQQALNSERARADQLQSRVNSLESEKRTLEGEITRLRRGTPQAPGVIIRNSGRDTLKLTKIDVTGADGRVTEIDVNNVDNQIAPGASITLPLSPPATLALRFNRYNAKNTKLGSGEERARVDSSGATVVLR